MKKGAPKLLLRRPLQSNVTGYWIFYLPGDKIHYYGLEYNKVPKPN